MATSLFHINRDGTLARMEERPYETENLFQSLIEQHPEILAGEQFAGDVPRRFVLVARELAVPDSADSNGRWAIDHLFLDQDAVPTLVEVKRSSDPRSRREVVGQMLDYAANGLKYWKIDTIRIRFEKTQTASGLEPDEVLADLMGGPEGSGQNSDEFWKKVEANFASGRVRMVFVVDIVPPELLSIVEFLSGQLRYAEIYAVEVRQHIGESGHVLATTVKGSNAIALQAQRGLIPQLSEDEWLKAFTDKHGTQRAEVAKKIISWMKANGETFVTKALNPSLGVRVESGGPWNKVYPFFIKANGKTAIQLSYLMKLPAFSDDDSRRALIDRVQQATGTDLAGTHLRGEIGFTMDALKDEKRLNGLLTSLSQLVSTIKDPVASSGGQPI